MYTKRSGKYNVISRIVESININGLLPRSFGRHVSSTAGVQLEHREGYCFL